MPKPSAFPFNQNTKEFHAPIPQRGGVTPGQLPESIETHQLGKSLAPGEKAPRQYTPKHPSNFIFALDATFNTLIQTPGTVLWVSSSDQTANVRIVFDNDSVGYFTAANPPGIPARNGFRMAGIPFFQFRVINVAAQAGLVIEVTVVKDTPDDRLDVDL